MNIKLVTAADVRAGDEILYPSNGSIRFLRVVRAPKIGKRTHWRTKQPLYCSVRCTASREVKTYNTASGHSWKKKEYNQTFEGHNVTVYVELNEKKAVLVNRKN